MEGASQQVGCDDDELEDEEEKIESESADEGSDYVECSDEDDSDHERRRGGTWSTLIRTRKYVSCSPRPSSASRHSRADGSADDKTSKLYVPPVLRHRLDPKRKYTMVNRTARPIQVRRGKKRDKFEARLKAVMLDKAQRNCCNQRCLGIIGTDIMTELLQDNLAKSEQEVTEHMAVVLRQLMDDKGKVRLDGLFRCASSLCLTHRG